MVIHHGIVGVAAELAWRNCLRHDQLRELAALPIAELQAALHAPAPLADRLTVASQVLAPQDLFVPVALRAVAHNRTQGLVEQRSFAKDAGGKPPVESVGLVSRPRHEYSGVVVRVDASVALLADLANAIDKSLDVAAAGELELGALGVCEPAILVEFSDSCLEPRSQVTGELAILAKARPLPAFDLRLVGRPPVRGLAIAFDRDRQKPGVDVFIVVGRMLGERVRTGRGQGDREGQWLDEQGHGRALTSRAVAGARSVWRSGSGDGAPSYRKPAACDKADARGGVRNA